MCYAQFEAFRFCAKGDLNRPVKTSEIPQRSISPRMPLKRHRVSTTAVATTDGIDAQG
jgi:hypothetical protein